jgi:hypothetical protein
MKEGFAKSWPIISARFQGIEAIAQARLRLAKAIVAVTSLNATNADDIARMAIDHLSLKESDAPDVLSGHQPG